MWSDLNSNLIAHWRRFTQRALEIAQGQGILDEGLWRYHELELLSPGNLVVLGSRQSTDDPFTNHLFVIQRCWKRDRECVKLMDLGTIELTKPKFESFCRMNFGQVIDRREVAEHVFASLEMRVVEASLSYEL